MKPSTKATLAVYINFFCVIVEMVVGICAIILTGYEIVLTFTGYFYDTDESKTLGVYDDTSTTAIYQYQDQLEHLGDSTKTVNWYEQGLSPLESNTAPSDGE